MSNETFRGRSQGKVPPATNHQRNGTLLHSRQIFDQNVDGIVFVANEDQEDSSTVAGWMGICLCVPFLMWFLSGLVLMYCDAQPYSVMRSILYLDLYRGGEKLWSMGTSGPLALRGAS